MQPGLAVARAIGPGSPPSAHEHHHHRQERHPHPDAYTPSSHSLPIDTHRGDRGRDGHDCKHDCHGQGYHRHDSDSDTGRRASHAPVGLCGDPALPSAIHLWSPPTSRPISQPGWPLPEPHAPRDGILHELDDDCDMQYGGLALHHSLPHPSAEADTTMDDSYGYGGPSVHYPDDFFDDVDQLDLPQSPLTVSLPANIPPHLLLPPLPEPPSSHDEPAHTGMAQQVMQYQEVNDEFEDLIQSHPMASSPANAISLGPENLDLVNFLRVWLSARREETYHDPARFQARRAILKLAQQGEQRIQYKDLAGDKCDFQGIDWPSLTVTREAARQRRKDTYTNYVNRDGSDHQAPLSRLRPDQNFLRFQGMSIKQDVRLLHFQLRNILGCASRSRAFYPSSKAIREIDPSTGRTSTAMSFENDPDAQTSTLTASPGILLAGGFFGDFRYRNLQSEDKTVTKGRLTDHQSGITNHAQIHAARHSHATLAAFASNDFGFRVVDLGTNQLVSSVMYQCIMNCSALSPDSRLRVMVGDHQDAFITDAETGRVLKSLAGHSDFGFACDWAPDGWTVATGNQDRTVRIWDARNWDYPVAVIPTELSGARSLRFSPLGSGKRILAAAEEADYLNIIDAGTFQAKQTFDIIGEIGGISFANEGSELLALCSDYYRGGLLQLRRCDHGAEDTYTHAAGRYSSAHHFTSLRGNDWLPEHELEALDSSQTSTQRRRQAFLAYGDLTPF
ncbi:WD40-repeat-containing domain protein [Microdochium bolleyi]|uniref:WD40-repeat-containing domain protein n=1 Tax=Microdochium bolleyi TaxID=196109 RepID=A0A136JDV3_9PEZI|nr:WD40-repeat-containing domain protein [Microdochium bolleyi]